MSGNGGPSVIKEFLAELENSPDDEIWKLAILAVGAAAIRAAQTRQLDVHRACFAFVDAMHKFVGTPAAPRQDQ